MPSVRPARDEDLEACVAVLSQLPGYFTPDTYDELRNQFSAPNAWVAEDDNRIVGFVAAERRYEQTAEIAFAAVLADLQGTGIGSALVDEALHALGEKGVKVVEVKTLDASAAYEPYEATRAFWESRGFHQVDCIDPLPGWQPGNPAAIYVVALAPTARFHKPN